MKRLKPWLIATIAAALTLSIVVSVSAQAPQPPSAFIGTVTSDDGPVAVGVSVEAYVGEILCNTEDRNTYADATTGATKYYVTVHNSSTRAGCGSDGDTITFRIDGRAATQTSAHGLRALETVNLTLAPEVTSVTINVAVWRRNIDPVGGLAISTQAPGQNWVTHTGWPLDMSEVSASGRWNRSEITPVEVTLTDGSTVTIDVAVWRRNVDPVGALAISTRAPGQNWVTHAGWPLDMSEVSASGRWNRSEITQVEVDLQ